MSESQTVALIANDVIGENMAGPGMRYWELARALNGRGCDVRLVVPPFIPIEDRSPDTPRRLDVRFPRTSKSLRGSIEDCDVLATLGIVLAYYPFLKRMEIPLVVDLYDPFLLSGLQSAAAEPLPRQVESNFRYRTALRSQLRAGDFFLCAAERQRDYWLGMLSALGRLNPHSHRQDPTFRQLIDVLPSGLPSCSPTHERQVLKGVHRSIGLHDKVVLWGGGIWNWLDAQTLIRAVPMILEQRDDVKIFFMGTKRPNMRVSEMEAVKTATSLSKELGLYESHVFFNDWVPYEERQNYLLEADIGVSLHLDAAETRFSFRTRLLDYVWAGLPTVATVGGVLGEDLATFGVAELVPPQDEAAVAACIMSLLDDQRLRERYSARAERVARRYHWDAVVQPLVDFCAAPRFAADRGHLERQSDFARQPDVLRWWQRARQAIKTGGLSELLEQAYGFVRWKMGRDRCGS